MAAPTAGRCAIAYVRNMNKQFGAADLANYSKLLTNDGQRRYGLRIGGMYTKLTLLSTEVTMTRRTEKKTVLQ